jgi:hypothetical protein
VSTLDQVSLGLSEGTLPRTFPSRGRSVTGLNTVTQVKHSHGYFYTCACISDEGKQRPHPKSSLSIYNRMSSTQKKSRETGGPLRTFFGSMNPNVVLAKLPESRIAACVCAVVGSAAVIWTLIQQCRKPAGPHGPRGAIDQASAHQVTSGPYTYHDHT